MKFSSPHKEKAEKTNSDTNPDQCIDCPSSPAPAPPKEKKELEKRVGNVEERVFNLEKLNIENQDRIGKLEGIVSNLQEDNIATRTTTHSTLWPPWWE